LEAPQEERTADLLVEVLAEAGVDAVFGVPGGAISPISDALLGRDDIRVITTRHEAAAMFAAAGYARMTAKPVAVVVTSGPGVLNAITGLASAHYDDLPIIVLAGEVPRGRFGRNALQEGSVYELNIVQLARPMTKLAAELTSPDGAAPTLKRAIATAMTGRRGPVLLTVPVDVANARIERSTVSLAPRLEFDVDEQQVRAIAAALQGARRPVIFAGSGTRGDNGPMLLRALAERLQVPVMTTPKAKGVFPEGHPLSLGVFGFGSHVSTTKYLLGGIDVMLALGTSLSEAATNGWSPLLRPSSCLAQIDIEARQIGRSYHVDLGLVAPIGRALPALLRQLRGPRPSPRRFGIQRHEDGAQLLHGPSGRIAPQRAIWELQQIMPPSTLYSLDIGEHMLFGIHHLRVHHPNSFFLSLGMGSMGSGIGAALGMKLAHPDRPVVSICGDGCFMMGMSDLATAAREGLPFVTAVMNDERYGMVELGNNTVFGRTPDYSVGPMNIPSLAYGVGARPFVIERANELMQLDLISLAAQQPIVLDIRIDRGVRMQSNARVDFLKDVRQAN
jgi:acetolactate synthase-1/2/3 large subunit